MSSSGCARTHWGERSSCSALVLLVGGAVFAGTKIAGDDTKVIESAPAPEVVVDKSEAPEEPADLGFPAFATRNTTRVAGEDSVANAAGVALATTPTGGVVKGPDGGDSGRLRGLGGRHRRLVALCRAHRRADPLHARRLARRVDPGRASTSWLPPAARPPAERRSSRWATRARPRASTPRPSRAERSAEIAVEVLELREKLADEPPEHILIASSDDPEFAMPAAAWAARSGDPVLFAQADSVPSPTIKAIERLEDVPVFVLGPEDVISNGAVKEISEATKSTVTRAAAEDDPGHERDRLRALYRRHLRLEHQRPGSWLRDREPRQSRRTPGRPQRSRAPARGARSS